MSVTTPTAVRTLTREDFDRGLNKITRNARTHDKLGKQFDTVVAYNGDTAKAASDMYREAADELMHSDAKYAAAMTESGLNGPAQPAPTPVDRPVADLTKNTDADRPGRHRAPGPVVEPEAPPQAQPQPVAAQSVAAPSMELTPGASVPIATPEPPAQTTVIAPVADNPRSFDDLVNRSSETHVEPVHADYARDSWLTVILEITGGILGFLIALGTFDWIIYDKWNNGPLLMLVGLLFTLVYIVLWVALLILFGRCIGRSVMNRRVEENRTTRLTEPR